MVAQPGKVDDSVYAVALVDAGLQTLPPVIASTPKARRLARRYGVSPHDLLLDVSLFYDEMKRHGIDPSLARPDIVHMFLMAASYSPLALEGHLRVFVHTRQGVVIHLEPGTRPPKNYFQFTKLMIQLLKLGRVPPTGKPLMRLDKVSSARQFLEKTGSRAAVILSEEGRKPDCPELWRKTYPNHIFLVGGFSKGEFRGEWKTLAADVISVSPQTLDAWVAADRLITCLERGLGLSL